MIRVTECIRTAQGRYQILFDNGVACLLYRGETAALHLEPGTELSGEQYDHLMKDVLGKRAKKRAMFLLQQMDRTEHQLREKLNANGYPAACVDAAVEYVQRFHYLDDLRFACGYVRCHQEKYSRQQLRIRLMQKGVSRELIRQALEEEFETDETVQILALMQKRRYDPDTAEEKEKNRTYAFLMRRGFSQRDIERAESTIRSDGQG